MGVGEDLEVIAEVFSGPAPAIGEKISLIKRCSRMQEIGEYGFQRTDIGQIGCKDG